ncbi:hypothetical protein PLESTF_001507500 [Pleodorina starrii]|nr:hypothetical protein PLESTF_001507500 [Pleodorina starrii]
MEGLRITIKGWEDGERYERQVERTDRWVLHTADELTLTVGEDKSVTIRQQPKAINATRMGVGACVWEGELFLAAYLASLPIYRYMGARVVELGSGPGLVGILLAKMGAKVHITDIEKVLPLIEVNIQSNGVGLKQRRGASEGFAVSEELEWGKEGYEAVVARLASEPVDWVLAADCCYIDQAGGHQPQHAPLCAHLRAPVRPRHSLPRVLRAAQLRGAARVRGGGEQGVRKGGAAASALAAQALPGGAHSAVRAQRTQADADADALDAWAAPGFQPPIRPMRPAVPPRRPPRRVKSSPTTTPTRPPSPPKHHHHPPSGHATCLRRGPEERGTGQASKTALLGSAAPTDQAMGLGLGGCSQPGAGR